MTRVCVLLALAITLQSVSGGANDPYTVAQRLLSEYSPQSTNLTSLLHLLEESALQNNPEAYLKLGEFHLFGLPMSPDNPDYLAYEYPFKRDFAKAVKYFRKAKNLGAKDASFYLEFLLHQSLIVEEMDSKVPVAMDYLYSHRVMQEDGLKLGSDLTKLSVVSAYRQCSNLSKLSLPDFLTSNFSTQFFAFPYFDEAAKCRRSCSTSVQYALQLANSALEQYHQTGSFPSYDIGPLHNVISEVHAQNPTKTLALMQANADLGDKDAVSHLANTYYHGDTALAVAANYTLAASFYERAAENGDVHAMETLGVIYSKGIGVEKNATRALYFLTKAVERGSVTAHFDLGFLYMSGDGVNKDTATALEHLQFAADHGNVESQHHLATLYLSGQHTQKDFKQGVEYLLKAVAAGHYPAIYRLGKMFLDGTNVVPSCDNALNLFWLVAEKASVSRYLRQGYNFVKYSDYEGAYLSFAMAGALGYESGQLSAGYMWEKGMVPFTCKYGNSFCAASYYAMSVLLTNSSWAQYRLGDISYYGSETITPELDTAFRLYELSQGLPESRYNLGYMYEWGVGVRKNTTKAQRIYEDLIDEAALGLVPEDVKYPAYLSLARLKAEQYFTEGVQWVEGLVTSAGQLAFA